MTTKPIRHIRQAQCKQTQGKRVFSGSRPTGKLHLGNYLGGLKGYIALQERGDLDCVYSVVDLHGITTPYDPKTYQQQIQDVVLDYLGAGLDPSANPGRAPKCHLMIQSQVPEHVELAYLLGTIYPVSRVEQLPTYKDKKAENPDYVNIGLFYYPILMAADILIYKAELVPVGKDQLPHIELTREVARKFNQMFPSPPTGGSGQVIFPEPQAFETDGSYVPSLTGEGKMSKSVEGSYINLTDDLETIKKKLAGAPTDSGKGEKVPQEGGVTSLLTLVTLFEGEEKRKKYEEEYLRGGIKYQGLKEALAEAIYKELKPIQERRAYFEAHPDEVVKILEEGREYCSKIAKETLGEVKRAMGLL
ncbi:MAG: tryptophan--tRNA ligase [bacterium]|nr:tryptophan--tRNA ligase [bacterium]